MAELPATAWRPAPGATAAEIARLRQAMRPFEPPVSYLELLRLSNGGEGELSIEPGWFQLFDVNYAIELWRDAQHRADFPNCFFFGSSGGVELIAMALTPHGPWPIVMIDPVAGIESSVAIATSFAEFVLHIGVDGASSRAGDRTGGAS